MLKYVLFVSYIHVRFQSIKIVNKDRELASDIFGEKVYMGNKQRKKLHGYFLYKLKTI